MTRGGEVPAGGRDAIRPLMESLFVTGTDTGVGKTAVSAGLARAASDRGIDIGVMKPFAASGVRPGFDDADILASAARTGDPRSLINPQFFSVPASPYTAARVLGARADVATVLARFGELQRLHESVIVEGMGGIMTPILGDYFVADLIREMGLRALIITGNRIGTINHTVMTIRTCKEYKIPIRGIIINMLDRTGYDSAGLTQDLGELTGCNILGAVPRLDSPDAKGMADILLQCMDMDGIMGRPQKA